MRSFLEFTTHEEYVELTQNALFKNGKNPLAITIFALMGRRAVCVFDKLASSKCFEKATELCLETFKEIGKESKQYMDITTNGMAMLHLAGDTSKEILTLAQENLLLA